MRLIWITPFEIILQSGSRIDELRHLHKHFHYTFALPEDQEMLKNEIIVTEIRGDEMRTEEEMFHIIIHAAETDDRVLAAYMKGSRGYIPGGI